MSFSLAPLLVHSDAVPLLARQALRDGRLEDAAHILYDETELECSDIRELVGLDSRAGVAGRSHAA